MPRPANSKQDIFKYINMHNGDQQQCWEWLGSWGGGRDGVDKRPYFDVDGRKHISYRIVYELTQGRDPKKSIIRHTCDNGGYPVGCCNPNHLQLGDHSDNMRDMTERQRHGLPHHTIRAIRKLAKEGKKHKDIAEIFGTTRSNVTKIVTGVSYKHLDTRCQGGAEE